MLNCSIVRWVTHVVLRIKGLVVGVFCDRGHTFVPVVIFVFILWWRLFFILYLYLFARSLLFFLLLLRYSIKYDFPNPSPNIVFVWIKYCYSKESWTSTSLSLITECACLSQLLVVMASGPRTLFFIRLLARLCPEAESEWRPCSSAQQIRVTEGGGQHFRVPFFFANLHHLSKAVLVGCWSSWPRHCFLGSCSNC